MPYSETKLTELSRECAVVVKELKRFQRKIVTEAQSLPKTPGLREHLIQGAGRRISVIRRAIQNIYRLFPPTTFRPLPLDTLIDVQLNLHAYLINTYGIYDNWAWAYVLRHGLEAAIGGKKKIGLFHKTTQERLPARLREHFSTREIRAWHETYLKSFRDALAHRVPPYVPPAVFTTEDGARYEELEDEKLACVESLQWDRIEQVQCEQAALGKACHYFLHSDSENESAQPILLHQQLLDDAKTVLRSGELFLKHWHENGPAPQGPQA